MSDNTFDKDKDASEVADNMAQENEETLERDVDGGEEAASETEETAGDATYEKLNNELNEAKDKYVRLVAEFENFRKRNAKERIELIQTAGKDVVQSLLEVLDDCDRAQKQLETSEDLATIKEGISLVFNKLRNTLHNKGLKKMESVNEEFNPDMHEAITEIPAPAEDLQGKVLDEIEPGYYLNDKLIRYAKVVVGK